MCVCVCLRVFNANKMTLEITYDFRIAQRYRWLIEPCARFSEFLMCDGKHLAALALLIIAMVSSGALYRELTSLLNSF